MPSPCRERRLSTDACGQVGRTLYRLELGGASAGTALLTPWPRTCSPSARAVCLRRPSAPTQCKECAPFPSLASRSGAHASSPLPLPGGLARRHRSPRKSRTGRALALVHWRVRGRPAQPHAVSAVPGWKQAQLCPPAGHADREPPLHMRGQSGLSHRSQCGPRTGATCVILTFLGVVLKK